MDAIEYARESIAADLRAARETAGLTQEDLAAKLGKTRLIDNIAVQYET